MEHNAEILKHYSFILREGGGKEKIEFSKKPSGTKVTYNSDNTNVATVNKKGYIAPKGEGTCTVTCTLEYKEKTKELSVFVQVKRRVNVEGKYNFGEMWDKAKETGSVEIQELNVNYGDIIDGKKHTWNGKPIGKGMRGAFISRWENG